MALSQEAGKSPSRKNLPAKFRHGRSGFSRCGANPAAPVRLSKRYDILVRSTAPLPPWQAIFVTKTLHKIDNYASKTMGPQDFLMWKARCSGCVAHN